MTTELPNQFDDLGKRSTFDPEQLLEALESIMQEIDLPVFIASPSDEFTEMLMELAA